jgi:hypothetical protein
MGALPPDEVIELLGRRLVGLDAEIAEQRSSLEKWSKTLPRLFLIESEYDLAMREAEAAWVRSVLEELQGGTMSGLSAWREFHATGRLPSEFNDLEERVRRAREAEGGSH